LILSLLLYFVFLILIFSLSKAFSQDHSSFFGSSEVEKKLVSEVAHLKVELAVKQAKLDSER
jgi:hypothetical protein